MNWEERIKRVPKVFGIVKSKHPKVSLGKYVGIDRWDNDSAIIKTTTGTMRITGDAIRDLEDYQKFPDYTKVMIESFVPYKENFPSPNKENPLSPEQQSFFTEEAGKTASAISTYIKAVQTRYGEGSLSNSKWKIQKHHEKIKIKGTCGSIWEVPHLDAAEKVIALIKHEFSRIREEDYSLHAGGMEEVNTVIVNYFH